MDRQKFIRPLIRKHSMFRICVTANYKYQLFKTGVIGCSPLIVDHELENSHFCRNSSFILTMGNLKVLSHYIVYLTTEELRVLSHNAFILTVGQLTVLSKKVTHFYRHTKPSFTFTIFRWGGYFFNIKYETDNRTTLLRCKLHSVERTVILTLVSVTHKTKLCI